MSRLPSYAADARASAARRWPPAAKLGGAVALTLVAVLTPARHIGVLGVVAAVPLLVIVWARVSPRVVLRRLLALSPFIAGVAIASAWGDARITDWRLTALRSSLAALTVVVLGATTTFNEMLAVLRRVRVPAVLVTTLALMDRYLFVLVDETERMRRARFSRTLQPGRRRLWWTGASVVGQLFVRASERAERVYAAMLARGWR
jgi:cobalt/nickel transport system permease protein